ncbi:hypothetical protein K469DRAFT_567517, partial [Zopfia rhizophila CBS 207.26]
LLKMVLNILLIPALSCDCERMFSEPGDMLEPQRRKLSAHLIVAIQCVWVWRKHGFRCMYIRKAYVTCN